MRFFLAFCVAIGSCASVVLAANLADVDRSIAKLPQFTAPSQQYCLMMIGTDATKRVWLLRDGDVLYVDRNGNGDLTEPGERVSAEKGSVLNEGAVFFKAGDIPDTSRDHKDLRVNWFKIDHLKDVDPEVKELLDRKPEYRNCTLMLDVAISGQHGDGADGRVSQMTWPGCDGFLEWAMTPAEAPVIHWGGPWSLVGGASALRAGKLTEVYLAVGTPGIGPGTTACVGYDGVIPRTLNPKAKVSFSGQENAPEPMSYELTQRCCHINLYGSVLLPDDAPAGKARLEVEMESWPGGFVTPLARDIFILPPKPGPKLFPVSSRLRGKLEHEHPRGQTTNISFSPDGRRLTAGDLPEGVVNIWDLATGSRSASFDFGEGMRGSAEFFSVTPDWTRIIAPRVSRSKIQRLERDGKIVSRIDHNGSYRAFDIRSGNLIAEVTHDPPHAIGTLNLSPDGTYLIAFEQLPGEIVDRRPGALWLRDAKTFVGRQVSDGFAFVSAISADSKLVSYSPAPDRVTRLQDGIRIVGAPQWVEKTRIRLPEGRCDGYGWAFLGNGRKLLGCVRKYPQAQDSADAESIIKVWNVEDGSELFSFDVNAPGVGIVGIQVSADERYAVCKGIATKENRGAIVFVDLQERKGNTAVWESGQVAGTVCFHPSGKWVVVSKHLVPANLRATPNPDSLQWPQPHLVCVDAETAEVMEDLVSPQGIVESMCFSPDGKTLATSGIGAVLLWDFTTPPIPAGQ